MDSSPCPLLAWDTASGSSVALEEAELVSLSYEELDWEELSEELD